jgi:hypothetical protein
VSEHRLSLSTSRKGRTRTASFSGHPTDADRSTTTSGSEVHISTAVFAQPESIMNVIAVDVINDIARTLDMHKSLATTRTITAAANAAVAAAAAAAASSAPSSSSSSSPADTAAAADEVKPLVFGGGSMSGSLTGGTLHLNLTLSSVGNSLTHSRSGNMRELSPAIFDPLIVLLHQCLRSVYNNFFMSSTAMAVVMEEMRDDVRKQQQDKQDSAMHRKHRHKRANNNNGGLGRLSLSLSRPSKLGAASTTISCNQISELSLESCLADSDLLELYVRFCRKEFSEGNIGFWLAVEEFRAAARPARSGTSSRTGAVTDDQHSPRRLAAAIYDAFIKADAVDQVPLDHFTVVELGERMKDAQIDIHLFDAAQKKIESNMKADAFKRFSSSDVLTAFLERRDNYYRKHSKSDVTSPSTRANKKMSRKEASRNTESAGKKDTNATGSGERSGSFLARCCSSGNGGGAGGGSPPKGKRRVKGNAV